MRLSKAIKSSGARKFEYCIAMSIKSVLELVVNCILQRQVFGSRSFQEMVLLTFLSIVRRPLSVQCHKLLIIGQKKIIVYRPSDGLTIIQSSFVGTIKKKGVSENFRRFFLISLLSLSEKRLFSHFQMRPRISIRGSVRPSVRPSGGPSVSRFF